MERSKDAITWNQWADDRSVIPKVRDTRKALLVELARTNGKESVDDLLNDIWLDKITPYQVSLSYINGLRDRELKGGTIAQYRSMLPGFFQSVLGEDNFSVKVFDRLVPKGDSYTVIVKKAPTAEELRHMLRLANPRDRALLGLLAGTGMRISEVVSRKLTEIKPGKKEGYYRLVLKPGETKARYRRWVPLTAETYKWIQDYHEGIPSPWIFPGEHVGRRPRGQDKAELVLNKHLTVVSAYNSIKSLFRQAGLRDSEDGTEIYSPHSYRKFAENYMVRCGLGEKFVGSIVGHAGPMGRAYKDEDDNETTENWFETCADKMTWLQEVVRIIEKDPEVETIKRENAAIKRLLLEIVQAQKAKLEPHEGHRPTEELAKLMELAKQLEDKKEAS